MGQSPGDLLSGRRQEPGAGRALSASALILIARPGARFAAQALARAARHTVQKMAFTTGLRECEKVVG